MTVEGPSLVEPPRVLDEVGVYGAVTGRLGLAEAADGDDAAAARDVGSGAHDEHAHARGEEERRAHQEGGDGEDGLLGHARVARVFGLEVVPE